MYEIMITILLCHPLQAVVLLDIYVSMVLWSHTHELCVARVQSADRESMRYVTFPVHLYLHNTCKF